MNLSNPMKDLAPGINWWRRPSALLLLAVNILPLWGVLFQAWEVFPVMLLYWMENLIIGIYHILKMLGAAGIREGRTKPQSLVTKLPTIAFFTVHYGMFCLVHGIFVVSLFGPGSFEDATIDAFPDAGTMLGLLADYGLFPVVIALLLSHGFSFVDNYLRGGEYKLATTDALFAAPYGRIVVLHLVILAGGFLISFSGAASTTLAMALLIILKSKLDLLFHLREHSRAGSRKSLKAAAS